MAQKGTEKTLQKLQESVKNGNYYEAHQMYRTVARRYNKQQKFGKAIHLLHSGAVSLMQHEQYASGSDLANYMLDTYNTANLEVDETSLDRVVELLSLYPADEPGRKSFIQNAFSWTRKHGQYQEGDPELHDYVGTMFYHERKYGPAEEHLLVGTDHSAELLGTLAAKESTGFAISRIVLQLLAFKNIHHATIAYKQYLQDAQPETTDTKASVRRAPAEEATEEPVYLDSWLNFTRMILLTVQRDAADLFRQLRASYAELTRQQKGMDELLDDIGAVFFNIPRPRKQGNMLQDLMNSLFAAPSTNSSRGAVTGSDASKSSGGMELD